MCSPMSTSLAKLLPPEFQNIDIKKIFPDFKRGRVLRFCKLFGRLKEDNGPQLYRSAKSSKARRRSTLGDLRAAQGDAPSTPPTLGHPDQPGTSGIAFSRPNQAESEDTEAKLMDDVDMSASLLSSPQIPSEAAAVFEDEKENEIDLTRMDDVEFMLDLAPTPPPDQCAMDDEMLQLKPEDPVMAKKRQNAARSHSAEADSLANVAPWRYGPASYWYDMMGVSETGEEFDYGFKLKKKCDQGNSGDAEVATSREASSRESQLMVNHVRWEDKIIWNGDEAREELRRTLGSGKQPICGWIPTQQTRTYEQFMATLKSGGFNQILGGPGSSRTTSGLGNSLSALTTVAEPILTEGQEPDSSFCILPPDNMDFINKRWEDDIIWDAEAMDHIPEPLILRLDATDPHTVLNLPEDKAPNEDGSPPETVSDESPVKSSDNNAARKDHQFTKKSQMIAGRVASRREEDDDDDEGAQSSGHMLDKDSFNISNDEYYLPRSSASLAAIRGGFIQHSIPAQNLMPCFFPTELKVSHLRHFHRPPFRLKKWSDTAPGNSCGIMSLRNHVAAIQHQRDRERKALGGGELFFMRKPQDLSARDGGLIFLEYSEEHHPLLSQPGMASKVRNYHKRLSGKDCSEPQFQFGETAYTHTSPFLGALSPGESLQALENNLFRTPIFQHQSPCTDFLIIRSPLGYFIRRVNTIFCVGQECPFYEVPGPNSKRATNFVRGFLLVYIYRLFWSSSEEPKRLRMEDVRRAFPQYAESSIRKRLKMCANFTRIGSGSEACYWVLRDDFRLPSQEELRSMVSPEMCCGYYSMVSAEQRLKDAGYGEKYFFTPEDEEEDQPVKIEDEVKCAPWNTTRSFIGAMKGKCLLDLTGPADPTGCGEGFSYIRESVKPPKSQTEQSEKMKQQMKRTVTGTDADLRKLSLKDAKALLKKFGITDEEIKTLTRWETIDVIRTLSTQQARTGGAGMTKFARGSMRFSLAEIQQRFKSECQRIFELQNKILLCSEPLSSDDESSADDSDLDEMGKNIENMLSSKKQIDVSFDAEEEDRLELQKLIHGDTTPRKKGPKGDKSVSLDDETDPLAELTGSGSLKWRKLKIYRTFRNENGSEYVAEETVTRPEVIDAYVRVRMNKDEPFIRHFVQSSAEYKEEKRREKRRLQDRLRRIKRNEQRFKEGMPIGRAPRKLNPNKKPPPPKPQLKMKCSACGKVGHMKTNKECAMYNSFTQPGVPPQQVAKTDEQIEAELAKDLETRFQAQIRRGLQTFSEEPKRLRMEDVRRAFPQYAESSIRKRLKMCANFTRIGSGSEACYWVLRDDFRLPSQEELRSMVSPEMCCGYYSMVSAEQRLKDAGYGEKYFFTPEDEEEDQPVKIEDEVKCAPWNTTRAFIGAMKGKCLLDLTGPADPTGCGEGFSYIRESVKPPKSQTEQSEKMKQQMKRTVTGTDADLRKLSLKDAKALLKKFGITDEEIKTLTRWETIDVIRTLSTQQARTGGAGMTKFARGSMRFSLAEIQQRFKSECQRIFELQNKILLCSEPLSSDDESSADDSDLDEMGKNIENMLSSKKQIDVSFDAEEEDRLELQKLIHGDTTPRKKGPKGDKSVSLDGETDPLAELTGNGSLKWRKLKIYRTFRNENGSEYVAEETVTRPEVIDAYVRVRMNKDVPFIRHFVQSSAEYKEEKRREKRRLQDRLRRIKRNEQRFKEGMPIGRAPRKLNPNKKPPPPKPQLKMKCSACGKVGHMKTNKECAMYNSYTQPGFPPQQVAKTDEQIEAELAKDLPADKRLVSVEGTKVKLSKTILEHANRVRRNALVLKFPKKALKASDAEGPVKVKKPIVPSVKRTSIVSTSAPAPPPICTVQVGASAAPPAVFVPQPVVVALPMPQPMSTILPLNPLPFVAPPVTGLKRLTKMPPDFAMQSRKPRFQMPSSLIRKPKPLSANYASLKLKLKRGPVGLTRPASVKIPPARRKPHTVLKPGAGNLDYLKRPALPQQYTHMVETTRRP